MGIKQFHIFFVAVSLLMSFGVGGYFFLTESGRQSEDSVLMGVTCLVAGAAILAYGIYFLRKLEREGIR